MRSAVASPSPIGQKRFFSDLEQESDAQPEQLVSPSEEKSSSSLATPDFTAIENLVLNEPFEETKFFLEEPALKKQRVDPDIQLNCVVTALKEKEKKEDEKLTSEIPLEINITWGAKLKNNFLSSFLNLSSAYGFSAVQNTILFSYQKEEFRAEFFYTPSFTFLPDTSHFLKDYKRPNNLGMVYVYEKDSDDPILWFATDIFVNKYLELFFIKKGEKNSWTTLIKLFKDVFLKHFMPEQVFLKDVMLVNGAFTQGSVSVNYKVLTRIISIFRHGLSNYEKHFPGLEPLTLKNASFISSEDSSKNIGDFTQDPNIFFRAKKNLKEEKYSVKDLLSLQKHESGMQAFLEKLSKEYQFDVNTQLSDFVKKIHAQVTSAQVPQNKKDELNFMLDYLFRTSDLKKKEVEEFKQAMPASNILADPKASSLEKDLYAIHSTSFFSYRLNHSSGVPLLQTASPKKD